MAHRARPPAPARPAAWAERREVGFIVLERGIDTCILIGRLFFPLMVALAEFDREAIVEGTLEGPAAGLSQLQLDEAQIVHNSAQHTAEQIADTLKVARVALYQHLPAHSSGRGCVLVVYRSTQGKRIDPDTNRRYGETGTGTGALAARGQFDGWPIAPARRLHVKVIDADADADADADGVVVRVRGLLWSGSGTRTTHPYPGCGHQSARRPADHEGLPSVPFGSRYG